MSLVTPDFGLLFWMVLIFGIVFLILLKWGFPAITGMVEKRNAHIAESLKMAAEAQQRMAELSAEQAKMIEQTKQEQAKILKEAAKARDEILAKAKEDAAAQTSKMIAAAKSDIDNEREAAMLDIRRQVSVLAVEVAEKVLRKELKENAAQMALIDKMVDEVAESRMPEN